MKHHLLLILSGCLLAACGSSDKDEPAPEVLIESASFAGSGCPSDTGSVTLTPDKKTLAIAFDEYIAEAGAGTGASDGDPGVTSARSNCIISIALDIPYGYRALLVDADYRLGVDLPEGASAEFKRSYRFANGHSPVLEDKFEGELSNDSLLIPDRLVDDLRGADPSSCGNDVILISDTSLYIKVPDADADTALIQTDSLDYKNKADFNYHLRYEDCSSISL